VRSPILLDGEESKICPKKYSNRGDTVKERDRNASWSAGRAFGSSPFSPGFIESNAATRMIERMAEKDDSDYAMAGKR
jgi:hypothetical protein